MGSIRYRLKVSNQQIFHRPSLFFNKTAQWLIGSYPDAITWARWSLHLSPWKQALSADTIEQLCYLSIDLNSSGGLDPSSRHKGVPGEDLRRTTAGLWSTGHLRWWRLLLFLPDGLSCFLHHGACSHQSACALHDNQLWLRLLHLTFGKFAGQNREVSVDLTGTKFPPSVVGKQKAKRQMPCKSLKGN